MLDQERLRDLTESYLKSVISDVADSLGPDFDSFAAFGELGINSFQVLKIIRKLEADFGTLPKSLLFENFNVNDLARYFAEKHEKALSAKFGGNGSRPVARKAAPIRIREKDAYADPELRELVDALYSRYKAEGCVSRGTRVIAPNLFIGSARRGYFHYGRSKDIVLVYAYAGPRDYVPELLEEIDRYCTAERLQLNVLATEEIPSIGGRAFSATPFGVMQRVVDLKAFTLDGGAMRRLRYLVSKFEKSGTCRTEEYRCGSDPEMDRRIVGVIDRWCESRTVVNPLIHETRAEILAGTLPAEHRLFLTYLDDVLQNVILITAMGAEENGYLMDLECYLPDMPLGGLEFAIAEIIGRLVREGGNLLSLGGTYGCKLAPSANADPAVDKILDELRAQNIFNEEGNLQFKNKFRPENTPIFLCRPVGAGNPDNVLDIIMMIADPLRVRTADAQPAAVKEPAPEAGGDDRSRILADSGFNPLNIAHEHVDVDLKTDSWAQLDMPAIDAQLRQLRGRLQQPVNVDEALRAVFPFAHFVLAGSGQAAEHILFKAWPRRGIVPQNLLFPSTIFHQIDNGFTPRELPHPHLFALDAEEPEKGEMAYDALAALVAQDPAAIPLACIEVGNNAAGGSAVSLRHLRRVKALLAGHSIPLVIDATRVLENAQFLLEAGQDLWSVAREILACADVVIGSLTKDFCVNRGGIIATNDAALLRRLQDVVDEEGAGIDPIDRKLIALSLQNRKHIEANVLRRMDNVRRMWRALAEHGVPVVRPAGGHCVLIDVKRIDEFKSLGDPVASFLAWLYRNTGIRAGAHSVGMQKRTAINDLVRLAIPVGLKREQVDVAIERLVQAFDAKANIPDVAVASGGVYAKHKLVEVHNAQAPAEPATHATPRRTIDVAIVGMAGRYPKAKNLRELWANLTAGRDCIEEIPADRYERRLRYGSAAKFRAGFIDEVDRFDSLFFNISPREAELMDPQERLFLEVAWEAIEDAGYYPEALGLEDGSRKIGVYVGAVWTLYQLLGVDEKYAGNKVVPSSFLWSIANRVSYALNLSGPSLTIDTACSSSLTALYLAFKAIQAGECSAAIVGGVNLDLHQARYDINQQGGALSADGVCRAFGKGANGYVMGEGVGALFLKPLDRAVQDGDNIYGVVKSAVVNHGGRTSGYSVPNPKAQAELIAAALQEAGVDARSIGYVEAHGTGTALGDPIEITALSNAFQSVASRSCAIGSVKTNIGHLEAAAGVVGVSKVLLQMKRRRLVPSLHAAEPNELIDFEHSPFYVVQALEEWSAKDGLPLRAGVSSFGAGGANAHIVLESYEPAPGDAHAATGPFVVPLSARNESELREAAARLAQFLRQSDDALGDVAWTLQHGRKSFEHRLAVVAETKDEVIDKLAAFAEGRKNPDVAAGQAKGGEGMTKLLSRREKQEFLRMVSQNADARKIAGLWVEGVLEGFPSDGAGKRVSLPTYPFADRRHWAAASGLARPALQAAAGVHPMVDSNESTFERQLFRKTFHDRDFFIYDHHVSGVATLPGVAYLEMARKAGELAAGRPVRKIRNVIWISPIAVEGSPKEVFIELKPKGDSVPFEVFSENGGRKTPHCQGVLLYATAQDAAAPPETIDIAAVRERCAKVIDGKTAYPLFRSFGLDLGPSFQVLQDVSKSDAETFGQLALPEFREGDLQSMVLHPSLVDGSLQAGMAAYLGGPAGEMLVPFSIGEVEILQPLRPHCFSHVTPAETDKSSTVAKSNVLIVDEAGTVLVKIRDSVGVPLRDIYKSAEAPGLSRLYYAYDWEKAPLAAAAQSRLRSVVIFDSGDALRDLAEEPILVRPGEAFAELGNQSYAVNPRSKDDFARLFATLIEKGAPIENIVFAWTHGLDLPEALERGVYAFLFVCQALIAHKLESKVQLLYLHSGRPHDEAMSGFVNTLRLEHPRLLCKTVETTELEAISAELQARTQDATVVRYAGGERFVRRLKPCELAPASAPPRIRENGVYLITGGAGGLGLLFAEFLAKEYKARLVLTGRSPSPPARLTELGENVVYLPADVSNRDDVANLVREAKARFGEIHGVIHAAGVLRDSLIRNKTAEEMRAVLAPKVFGTLNLDEFTKDEPLDFFVTFSSLAAVAGNGGQCDYAFANAFMDAFAAARPGRALSVNWSIWADGGMKLDEQTEQLFKKNAGIWPLSTAAGLDAFARALASDKAQVAVLEGVREKVELAWGAAKKAAPAPEPARDSGDADLAGALQREMSRIVMDLLKLDAADVAPDKILLDLGFDSIGLTGFANAINETYQLDITPVLFFDYPSIGEIAKHLAAERREELLRFHGHAAPVAAVPPPAIPETAPLAIAKGWSSELAPSAPAGNAFSAELRFVHEPIAIVGMSGVMPQSEDLDEFWENLKSSRDLVTLIPPDRWKWEDYYGDPLKEVNKTNSKWGGFMKEVDRFDPLFFGISPREAGMMDPQQRIFLQTVWRTIEDSGQKVSDLSGTKTGVFVGVATYDYTDVLKNRNAALDGYSASGNSHSVLANRVSFLLNLRGPSAPIDTACSSSLIALHRAIESIHTGSCDMAIVGGVHVNLSPGAFISFSSAGMLSPDGKCKTFDKRANGYVRGEGSGAIFIKRLRDAEADGNHIYAVIKSTAENHGGKVSTMTAPNSVAQAELLIEAYEKAQVDPATVGYIECHGTGTPLGDPIEIQSLTKAFSELYKKHGRAPAAAPHCGLSSVKTNIGHLETAAGIASILKALLAFEHKLIPANIHFEELNPYIKLDGTPFYIVDKPTPWDAPAGVPRRAGVSSFGFGGANAHVVLEEYVAPARHALAANEPRLIVLSAKNEERLDAYVRSMHAYLAACDVDLADFAYTLQVGRDEMPERLALVVASAEELQQKFATMLSGGTAAGSWRNRVRKAVDVAVDVNDLSKAAEAWVSGAKVDWRRLYDSGTPRRIALPTYPFARERHWIPDGVARPDAAPQLHPLIHRNVSTLREQKFASRFSGNEFFLAEHRLQTERVLPGVAYLEMVAAAGELSGDRKVGAIRNVVWMAPLTVGDRPKDVEVSLSPGKGEIDVVVKSGETIHCRGKLAYADAEREVVSIADIEARCSDEVISAEELYPFLFTSGLSLGKGFQVVQNVRAGRSECLAVLKLPEHLQADAAAFSMHPAMLDGAVQTAVGMVKRRKPAMPWSVPYSVGEVRIFGSLKDVHYAHATWDLDSLNADAGLTKVQIVLLASDGRVLVRMKDFAAKSFRAPSQAEEAALQAFVPVWNRSVILNREDGEGSPPGYAHRPGVPRFARDDRRVGDPRLCCLGGDDAALDWLRKSYPSAERIDAVDDRPFDQLLWIAADVESQEEGVLAVFRAAKALQSRKNLRWTIVTRRTQRVAKEDIDPTHAGIVGLVGSLAKEMPQWDLRLLDLDSLDVVSARECLSLPFDKQGNALAHRRGEWFRQELAVVAALPDASPRARENGVYVVVGGAGGVGEVWTRFMIERHQANVVWIGRREINAAIQAKIDALSALGPAPLYIAADATNLAALEQAAATIRKTYPAIHGVVHAAIVLHDQSITRMDEQTFLASFRAKADVSVNIDRVFGDDDLDFLLFFSSIVSFVKSPGQSNYAAGCTFKDSFAQSLRQRRRYPVKIINWGYWGDVGVVADESYRKTMAQMGIGSIGAQEGMAALQALMGSDLDQLAVVKASATLFHPSEVVAHCAESAPAIALPERTSQQDLAALEAQQPTPEMNALATAILAASVAAVDVPAPQYERWMDATRRYLQQHTGEIRALDALWSEWDAKCAVWATTANLRAQVALLEACLKALPAIVTGKRRATDVMFPGSSMALVEGVYRGNAQADHFNAVLGETLTACIERQLAADPARKIRILEIGAGTGGTTAALLPALRPYPIAEYCYTDISKAFLMHAEAQFRPSFPALTTALFDVTKPLASQSIVAGRYDFAVAANVLHATPDVRETVRNAKAALKHRGVLLLNEISAWSLFNHLTFGLLDGWWLSEDTALRLPGGPGVAPETWRALLSEEGFEGIVFPAEGAHRFGQQIVAACSNGWTRQRLVAAPKEKPIAARPAPAPEVTPLMSNDSIRTIITEKLSESLRMEASAIRSDAPFADYGVDSIIGVNLVRSISEALEIELETTSLFEYSTVDDLAGYIATKWQPQIARAASAPPAETRIEIDAETRFAESAPPAEVQAAGVEPIAIIGMSGRFAQSESLEAFWDNLAAGKNLIGSVTRWPADECVMPGCDGQAYCSHGSYLDSYDQFDPAFFGIAPQEATYMDPQQRLFLEESWRALEDAGYASKSAEEKQCGVYVGCGTSNYTDLFVNEPPPPQAWWGNSHSVVAARIAYHLDLQGPAVAVDTACSSVLVTIHLACQGLWSRETEMALAGGVYVQATPAFHKVANRAAMLSPDGKCYSFDARANGFAPGEAVGAIVLKRLRDALRDGDHVHGVIAGSGINQDGSSNGLIAPNARAQERLERSVYERFAIDPATIQMVEAHGTATVLGDSIEVLAISRAFRDATDRKQFCAIGSVKTNLGHSGNAAGIASVMKVLLSLRHRQIPPSLHFERSNPAIDFASTPFYVNTELREWCADGDGKRRAAVSGFGFSGTNAHLILEEPPAIAPTTDDAPAYVVALSARTAEQLTAQVRNLAELLRRTPDLSMNDLSYTLFVGRTHFAHRLSCLARTQPELIALLEQWLETGAASSVYAAKVPEGKREPVSLSKFGNYCIQECRNATSGAAYLENLTAIAELYVQGCSLDYAALFPRSSKRIPLPTYPFARERYWVGEARRGSDPAPPAAPSRQRAWRFSKEPLAAAGVMSAAEKMTLFLRQEAALQLQKPIDEVPIDQSFFDLGLTSLGMAHLVRNTCTLLDQNLAPSVLFDHTDIQSLAAYLAAEYQTTIDAVAVVRRDPTLGDDDASIDEILDRVSLQEASLDDAYEKITV